MRNQVIIENYFGHEIMAALFAQVYNLPLIVCPRKDDEEEYNTESEKIVRFMSYFTDLRIVPFKERETARATSWNPVAELKAGTLSDTEWIKFFSEQLEPALMFDEPDFKVRYGKTLVLVVPQKLVSDGECGVTAAQQSVNPDVFSFLKGRHQMVLGQHFNKVSDLETVKKLAQDYSMYVPGMTENPEVLGLRGVEHRLYHHLYSSLSYSVGIAGTHTWIMLTMFPKIPQVILYNTKGVENWQAIARAARRNGRKIVAIGFDENTDMMELSKRVERAYKRFDINF